MDKAVNQAVTSLIPEFNNPLPPELLELAVSLLAQSRNKASSLKPEEEIARTYVCAHLACERLKPKLGLPKIQPRPPCPPKVYQKLHRYLDSTLVTGARRTARASKPAEPATPSRTPTVTPRKTGATPSRTPASARAKRKREAVIREEIPGWVMPAIRGLCKRFAAPIASPHVFAGVSSILTLPPPNMQEIDDTQFERLRSLSTEALIISVYILVRTRLLGVETDPKGYSAQRDDAVAAITELRRDEESSVAVDSTSVDAWMMEINKGGWTEMDWLENVVEGAGLALNGPPRGADGDDSDSGGMGEEEDSILAGHRYDEIVVEKPFLQPGLGTMVGFRFPQTRMTLIDHK
ncbi:MAG: hypothetical protein LQ348_000519 [Seirophora lacunosa]|nr:MAG: hypothetical protein LQ348_000519 [Seirophora lacunosa]